MIKFQRNYRLTLELNDGGAAIIITPPLTAQFTINRSVNAALNTMDLAIFNLGEQTRQRIFHDSFDFTNYKRVIFEAGYGNQLSTLFIGNIFEASSARQGSNIITSINSRSGFYDVRNTRTYATIAAGATLKQVLLALVGDFPNINKNPVVGDIGPDAFPRAVPLMGNTYDILQEYASPMQPYIDNERLYLLQNNEIIAGTLPLIDASTGLLETPRRSGNFLSVTTLFEPRVQMGQGIQVVSAVEPIYNGAYKVLGIEHQGIISEAVNGECRSTFSLLVGNRIFSYTQAAS